MSHESYSLFELNTFFRRIFALNLPDLIWVRCEIAQVNQSRGHYYLDLIEKGEGPQNIIARLDAVIWQKTYRKILRKRGSELNYLLQDGMEVQLSVKVDFHEQYGLKLIIEDIDPTYTLGKMELKRRETIQVLKDLDLLRKNSQLLLPDVLQKVAVLSSERAAGFQDYLEHLVNNDYGYAFDNQLFETAVQGINVEQELISQLEIIKKKKEQFDCVVIIRGGGARLDLSAFDSLELCKAIANFPLPVFTGIGHDVDETVADMVAYQSLKTPTAVADFLIQKSMHFESTIIQMGMFLNSQVNHIINDQNILLEKYSQILKFESQRRVNRAEQMLEFVEQELPRVSKLNIENSKKQLENIETIIRLLDPETALKRGFTITSKNGKSLHSKKEIKEGDILTTTFWDGTVKSKTIKTLK